MRAPSSAYQTAVATSQDKGRLVHLVELVLGSGTYRYAINRVDVTYGGYTYTATAGSYTELQEDTGRQVPSARLTLQNADGVLGSLLDAWGLSGEDGRRKRARILTAEEGSIGTTDSHVVDEWVIEAYPTMTRVLMVFELGVAPALSTMVPSAEVQGWACRWVYKGRFCGYVGDLSTCKRNLDDCAKHDNVARFGADPGRNVRQVVFR